MHAFIINHMVDQLVLKCTVKDEPEVKCDECFRNKPIKAFCSDCSSLLCHCCIDYHTCSKQFQDHHLVVLLESHSNKSLAVSCSTTAPDPQQCQTIDVPLLVRRWSSPSSQGTIVVIIVSKKVQIK